MASPMASPLEDDEATVETVDDGYYTEDPSTAAGKEASGGILISKSDASDPLLPIWI